MTNRLPFSLLRLRSAAIVAALIATPAGSSSQEAPPTGLPALLQALDAADYQSREAATDAIMADQSISVDRLYDSFVNTEDLSHEQIERLQRILEDRYAASPAVMGISMAPDPGGLEVRLVVANSPAEQVLQPGDVLHTIDGEQLGRVNSMEVLYRALARRMPGETIRLEVARNGEISEIQLALANGRKLVEFTRSDLESIERRRRTYWRQWLEELAPGPILLPEADRRGSRDRRYESNDERRRLEAERRSLVMLLDQIEREMTNLEQLIRSVGDPDFVTQHEAQLEILRDTHERSQRRIHDIDRRLNDLEPTGDSP